MQSSQEPSEDDNGVRFMSQAQMSRRRFEPSQVTKLDLNSDTFSLINKLQTSCPFFTTRSTPQRLSVGMCFKN